LSEATTAGTWQVARGDRSGGTTVCRPANAALSSGREMPLTPQDMREALTRRLAAFAEVDDRAAAAARTTLPLIVDVLVRDFGATKVILFGSLVSGLFRVDSDIDLAVEGIPANRQMRALARATEIAGRPVDLVDLDWADEVLKAVIARGESLHVTR
jgi:uncharacterized protein